MREMALSRTLAVGTFAWARSRGGWGPSQYRRNTVKPNDGFWTYPLVVARLWALDDLARQRRSRARRGASGLWKSILASVARSLPQ
jgi:hypothetical protein